MSELLSTRTLKGGSTEYRYRIDYACGHTAEVSILFEQTAAGLKRLSQKKCLACSFKKDSRRSGISQDTGEGA